MGFPFKLLAGILVLVYARRMVMISLEVGSGWGPKPGPVFRRPTIFSAD
jgi:hypothetical protein